MTAEIIDGKKLQDEVLADLGERIRLKGLKPRLATVLVGKDPASIAYVNAKAKACARIGIGNEPYELPEDVSEEELLSLVRKLNQKKEVHGILVQFPLPKGLSQAKVIEAISPEKDVDGLHPINLGKLLGGNEEMPACTPSGVIALLEWSGVGIAGKRAVVIGRSIIVGKPLAALLLNRNATVTVCHSKTENLAEITGQADILCVAIGKPRMITKEMVKPGATVIDVGINRIEGKIIGDVDFDSVKEVAGKITPVPGGVGPMTIAMLLRNTVVACERSTKGEGQESWKTGEGA